MDKTELINIREKIFSLIKTINYHDNLYYNENYQEISDQDYDKLRKELIYLEKKYPELKLSDSPSEKVGNIKKTATKTFLHSSPMLSLNNAYTNNEVEQFYKKITSVLGSKIEIIAETKVDGLSASLRYKNRKLFLALTRGDGFKGEDITNNVLHIDGVKPILPKEFPEDIEIRGEIFMPKDVFKKLNLERKKNSLNLFSTPRNAAAGSVRQLDANITKRRKLSFFGYTVIEKSNILGESVTEIRKKLEKFHFKLNNPYEVCTSVSEMVSFHNSISDSRENLNYDIDGIVYKVNSLAHQKKMGNTSRWPRWALAHKFNAETGYTKIKDVIFQVGRTGSITPVALLKELNLGGVKINRATLHNEDEIKRLDLKIGDIVSIKRAGDVIPKITGVVKEQRGKTNQTINFPDICPSCGSELVRKKSEAAVRCPNIIGCEEQRIGTLSHFISRQCFNIDGLGQQQLRLFWKKGFVKSFHDFFTLEKRQSKGIINIMKLEGWGEKSLKNLFVAIDASRSIEFSKLIFALGIRHVGQNTASLLSSHFENIDKLMIYFKKQPDNDIPLTGIGSIILKSLHDYFIEDSNEKSISCLLPYIKIQYNEINKNQKYSGKSFVITGSFEEFSREEIKGYLMSMGAKVISSISKNTDYLIVGKMPGSKLKKAKNLGVKVISLNDLQKI